VIARVLGHVHQRLAADGKLARAPQAAEEAANSPKHCQASPCYDSQRILLTQPASGKHMMARAKTYWMETLSLHAGLRAAQRA
jgi:hypothetical protein